ncbi:hypothetical protein PsalN5692_03687 (plasmid) [Piscirickettsia salmonis]|uniref:antitoxin Xre-like helix-turn-helix domain-containing protein n=1 Tax=Piscirickettsia salmonis TaxID=1238 RepID=UPI0012B6C109|nr:antitoxin Xre-like helix-turn-helix domain-containing protein [Piscirickettsia salmonis]QGP52179.1 hypothetical protein PsalN5692_03687 [Piscirickettsia salmonis]
MLDLAYDRMPSNDELLSATKMVVKLFYHWNLTEKEQQALLNNVSRSQLQKFKRGNAHITTRDSIERLGNLLGIHKSLRILFSDKSNRDLVYKWIKARNVRLQGLSPLQVMLDKGYRGIEQVRLLTDFLRGQ